jgi:hypothetical protein
MTPEMHKILNIIDNGNVLSMRFHPNGRVLLDLSNGHVVEWASSFITPEKVNQVEKALTLIPAPKQDDGCPKFSLTSQKSSVI